jgi:hypothetical protein
LNKMDQSPNRHKLLQQSIDEDRDDDYSSSDDHNAEGRTPKVGKEEVVLNEKTCPILRDSKSNFAPLERFFGALEKGMAFGELALN